MSDQPLPEKRAPRRESARERHMRLGKLAGLRLVREAGFVAKAPAERPAIRSPRDVVQLMTPISELETTEVFWVLLLDSQHRLLEVPIKHPDTGTVELVSGPVVITRGILNSSLVHPRECFKPAILHGAAAVILCHNHPSGDPTPSADDRVVTDQLVSAGRLMDLPVHDHVIIGRGQYASFAEQGLL